MCMSIDITLLFSFLLGFALRRWICLAFHVLSSDTCSSSAPLFPQLFETLQMALEGTVEKGFLGGIAKGEPVSKVGEDFEVFDRSEHGHGQRAGVGRFYMAEDDMDCVAKLYLPNDFPGCDLLLPKRTCADMNCLFRSASFLATGSEKYQLEYRLRAVL